PRPRGRVRLRLPRRAALAPAPPAPAPRPPTSAILGLGWRISRARGTCSPPEVQDRRGGSVGRRGGEEGGSVGWVLGGAQLVRVGERGAAQRRLRVHPGLVRGGGEAEQGPPQRGRVGGVDGLRG